MKNTKKNQVDKRMADLEFKEAQEAFNDFLYLLSPILAERLKDRLWTVANNMSCKNYIRGKYSLLPDKGDKK